MCTSAFRFRLTDDAVRASSTRKTGFCKDRPAFPARRRMSYKNRDKIVLKRPRTSGALITLWSNSSCSEVSEFCSLSRRKFSSRIATSLKVAMPAMTVVLQTFTKKKQAAQREGYAAHQSDGARRLNRFEEANVHSRWSTCEKDTD